MRSICSARLSLIVVASCRFHAPHAGSAPPRNPCERNAPGSGHPYYNGPPSGVRIAAPPRPAQPRPGGRSLDLPDDGSHRSVADHGVQVLVITEVLVPNGAGRNKSVRAGVVEFDEQPDRVTPETRPSKVAPTRSARKCAISRSTVSRSAFMARRSEAEIVPRSRRATPASICSGKPSRPSRARGSARDARPGRHSAGSGR